QPAPRGRRRPRMRGAPLSARRPWRGYRRERCAMIRPDRRHRPPSGRGSRWSCQEATRRHSLNISEFVGTGYASAHRPHSVPTSVSAPVSLPCRKCRSSAAQLPAFRGRRTAERAVLLHFRHSSADAAAGRPADVGGRCDTGGMDALLPLLIGLIVGLVVGVAAATLVARARSGGRGSQADAELLPARHDAGVAEVRASEAAARAEVVRALAAAEASLAGLREKLAGAQAQYREALERQELETKQRQAEAAAEHKIL